MKKRVENLLLQALQNWQAHSGRAVELPSALQIDRTRSKEHGDLASNVALILAKKVGMAPRDLAAEIITHLPESDIINKTAIAGPGFINFYINEAQLYDVVQQIFAQGAQFGHCNLGQGQKVNLEFVSANPTGPLHVGHGRGTAFSASLANLLEVTGFKVHREYYVNDAGRQMDILAVSVWLRYLECQGEQITFPSNGYRGDYIIDIAKDIIQQQQQAFVHPAVEVFADIPADEPAGGDKEQHVDALIVRAKQLIGDQFDVVHAHALNAILDDIRDDLALFGVEFQEWFREKSLFTSGAVDRGIEQLQAGGHTYEHEGALWFNSVHFGDEKDRVLRRANGATTYFASDVAYLTNKFDRGFEQVKYVFGADHHGYVARLNAACKALGKDPQRVDVLLVQFAVLYRGDKKVQMSTRSGEFVTLRQLREEVGKDAARFFYVMRRPEQHMDFDMELAKSQSADNPVYYIQYAHARICSVMRQLAEKGFSYDQAEGLANLQLLTAEHEVALLNQLTVYPELILAAARAQEPHQLCHYLRNLANHFHTYYNAHQFLVEQQALRNARLCLISAARQVLINGLAILGVGAPEEM